MSASPIPPAASPLIAQNRWPLALSIPLAFAAWWLLPFIFTSHLEMNAAAKLALQNDIRDTLAKAIWAALTLWGALGLWRNFEALSQIAQNGAQTLAAAERTAFFAAQAGETQRYAGAMALLASDQTEVRLGGIYALERLARESERDHGPIIEVLCTTVRNALAWSEGQPVAARLGADHQAILTVIGRRHAPFDAPGSHLDLHGSALARAYLPHANLAGAFLYESNLSGAILQGANLQNAILWRADLTGAVLDGANLSGADLTGVAGLTHEQIKVTLSDGATKWPQHLRSDELQTATAPAPESTQGDFGQIPTKR